MEKDSTALNFLQDFNHYYLSNSDELKIKSFPSFHISDIALYKVNRITFEEKAPRKEALENVISAMRIEGTNLIYLLLSDGTKVDFYFGVARNLYQLSKKLELSVNAIGEKVLLSSITGNFRGSVVEKVSPRETRKIVKRITQLQNASVIEGVPGIDQNKENFQTVDRLVDVMCGDAFGVLVIASTYSAEEIFEIQRNLEKLYTNLSIMTKQSIQEGKNNQTSLSKSKTDGTSEGSSTGTSKTKQTSQNNSETKNNSTSRSTSKGTNETSNYPDTDSSEGTNSSATEGSSEGKSVTTGTSESDSFQESKTTNKGVSKSVSTQEGSSVGSSTSYSYEQYNKSVKDWIEYLDRVIFPRLDYGKGKGIFSCCSLLLSGGKGPLRKLSNTYISLYSGSEGNRVPLRYQDISAGEPLFNTLMQFQNPLISSIKTQNNSEIFARAALSQNISQNMCAFGNWYSTNELSLVIGLPQKEVHGLSLREEIEFGLNYEKHDTLKKDGFEIGNLVEAGVVLSQAKVYFDRNLLNKHIFVTGVTGSGKTTTCQNLLLKSNLPFLVIEPAKTEYRILKEQLQDFVIFTLGNDMIAPFRLNPFEFFPHESITSHVDMVKASIEAAFDMEAAIPQMIESAIYRAYEVCGWNIETNCNEIYQSMGKDPFMPNATSFPTLSEVITQVDAVVKEQGFADRLKSDYIGSIKARLQSLTIGAKGQMLNTPRSINFKELLHMKVVLEIEEVKNGNEKAFIMGLVMSHLNEAIRAEYFQNASFRHITLIEEAHRLLSKAVAGDSPNKKHGAEVFADMLAEVRKYGESLIIADQIPDKMIPEVLKNTNTKIVHRLFAQDDKNAIGNTMALTDDQKNFLSSLDVGRAVVFSQGYEKAIQVQVTQTTDTSSSAFVTQERIHQDSCKYLYDRRNSGLIPGLQYLNIHENAMDEFLKQHRVLLRAFFGCLREKKPNLQNVELIKIFVKTYDLKPSAAYFAYRIAGDRGTDKLVQAIEAFLQLVCTTLPENIHCEEFRRRRDKYIDLIRK